MSQPPLKVSGSESSTLLRGQRQALAAVCAFLKEKEQSLHAPPFSLRPVPRIENFIGREKELAAYQRRLEEEHVAVIAGPPGVGKTALGAEVAAAWKDEDRFARQLIWVTLHNGRNTAMESLLESIALALAATGQPEYWRFLQTERHKEFPLSSQARVRYLLTVLETPPPSSPPFAGGTTCPAIPEGGSGKGGYLLCLDDFHLASENAAIQALCADLLRSARQGRFKLLVMSRTAPPFLGSAADWLAPSGAEGIEPLGGLSREDSRRLLEACGLPGLPEAVFTELYTRTGGLPIFLKLFAAWAKIERGEGDRDSEAVRERLAAMARDVVKEQNIRSYLLHQVYESLSPQERRFLTCAATFRLPFDTEEPPIVALLQAEDVPDVEATWMALAERYIFTRLEGQNAVMLHPLVRAYFRQRLRASPGERARIHRRIGEYYEQGGRQKAEGGKQRAGGDALEAGYHYAEAGEQERAAQALTGNVNQLINAGQAELALEQLEQLTPRLAQARAELRIEAAAARESFYHLLGLREKQRAALDTILALAEKLGDPSTGFGASPRSNRSTERLRWQAKAHNRRARFHQAVGEFAAALAAAEAGQAAARQAGDSAAEAEGLVLGSQALWQHGEYDAARERLEQALVLARAAGERQIEADSLNKLGNVGWVTGEYAAARERLEQSLAMRQVMGDRPGEAISLNSLGNVHYGMENYAAARQCYEQVLAIVRALCDRQSEAGSLNNLGVIYRYLGDYAAALTCHAQALAIRQAIGDRGGEADSLNNLGNVYEELGDYTAARTYCERSLALEQTIGDRRGEASNLDSLGKLHCRAREYAAARACHVQSLSILQAIGYRGGAGFALTYLGMALEGLGETGEAEAAYREALAIRRELGQAALAIEDVAGLAKVAMRKAESQRREAKQCAEECLTYIAANGVNGIEYVFEVYLTCVRVLEACGEHERARAVLEEAHTLLVERAGKIEDEALRRSYLENVPANREVVQRLAAAPPRAR